MNKELLKNRKVVVSLGIVALAFLGLIFFVLTSGKSLNQAQNTQTNALPTQVPVPTITADSIGLTLKAGLGGKTIIAAIANPQGITAVEYELSYISKGDIPRGAIGQFDLTKKPVKKEITLGTCSDTCHYDQDVTDIKIVLKITKTGGMVYQAEQKLSSIEQ